jgi:hypothetical protein
LSWHIGGFSFNCRLAGGIKKKKGGLNRKGSAKEPFHSPTIQSKVVMKMRDITIGYILMAIITLWIYVTTVLDIVVKNL